MTKDKRISDKYAWATIKLINSIPSPSRINYLKLRGWELVVNKEGHLIRSSTRSSMSDKAISIRPGDDVNGLNLIAVKRIENRQDIKIYENRTTDT